VPLTGGRTLVWSKRTDEVPVKDVKLVELLHPEAVIPDLAGQTTDAVLAELCRPLARDSRLDGRYLFEALAEREKRGSTGMGEGVAIPHARIGGLATMTASFGRSRVGIDFGSFDGKPVHFFFALFTPQDKVGIRMVGVQICGIHVKALARISLVLKEPTFRGALLQARDAGQIHRLIAERDLKGTP